MATRDGSVVDANGKVIFFSTDRFVNDICLGNCCFMCGTQPDAAPFNNEHILPEWLLRHYDLFAKTIRLPNDVYVRYDRYTVPCCAECNHLMGEIVERPISQIIKGGLKAINDFALKGGLLKIFVWMGLIYLKTHLKDRSFRAKLDARDGKDKIADEYEWEYLHHIHSVTRCFYTNCFVEKEAIGSFLTAPVKKVGPDQDRFDFVDLYMAQTMLLRLDDVALFAVFNDSGGALSYFEQKLEKISGPVSGLQLREMMVELAWLNLHLKDRPAFRTEYDLQKEACRIVGMRPSLGLVDMDLGLRGALLGNVLKEILDQDIIIIGRTKEEALEAVRNGTLSFLFDDNGQFISEVWKPLP